ncbi:MAG: S8 family serine peptidase [Candidatus Latescibacteria bacterium]|nr:S8 family serine peptidase [bacterium]MBD3423224.1 S8 family serine peptidase [Candidatus Latescibacterota bacterium]
MAGFKLGVLLRRTAPLLIIFLVSSFLLAAECAARPGSISEKLRSLDDRSKQKAVELAIDKGLPVRGSAEGNRIFEIMGLSEGPPLYYILFNRDAAVSTRTDSVLSFTSGGEGFRLGIWDGGHVRSTHREFQQRVVLSGDASYRTSTHATHVGGTMVAAGVDSAARGMAPGAELVSYEWNNDESEVAEAAADGLLISNHSYGYVRGWLKYGSWYWYGDININPTEDYLFGFYSERSRVWDEVANASPYCLIVSSAGNDRGEGPEPGTEHLYWDSIINGWTTSTMVRDLDGGADGYDCLPEGNSTAKNLLVVGAVEDYIPDTDTSSVEMTFFSAWGPADDGRIKPDICGNGYALYSCSDESDSEYIIYSGTSMASPNVCGTLALIHDYYIDLNGGRKLKAASVKGLALHTARNAGDHGGPDYRFGWGLLDALEASRVIEEDASGGEALIVEMTLLEGTPMELQLEGNGSEQMRITICWNDPAGEVPEPALNPRIPVLVNDLDLRAELKNEIYQPWILDPENPSLPAARGDNVVDNVEQVVVKNPGSSTVTVTVGHKGTLEGGKQEFSLIASGIGGARIIRVLADGSGDAPDISSAVRMAGKGDQVLVYPGTYREHDITLEREILLKGVGGPENTEILAEGEGRCLIVEGNAAGSIIEGFNLVNGEVAGRRGGGMLISADDISVSDCRLSSCTAESGGGIYLSGSGAEILNCDIRGCSAEEGAGIYIEDSGGLVKSCLVAGNAASTDGGGVYIQRSTTRLENCTIADNSSVGDAGGIMIGRYSYPQIINSIIAFNQRAGICSRESGGDLVLQCCDIYGNGSDLEGDCLDELVARGGNFSLDPVFCDPGSGNFTIGDGSPCTDNRSPCGVRIGSEEIGCHTRTITLVEPDGSGDTDNIQEALNEAEDGDTIFLAPGTFTGRGNRDISTRGKSVVIESVAGADSTILDCSSEQGGYNGFFITGGETRSTVIKGVTITGAAAGAIWCEESSPRITECVISGNSPSLGFRGGGIYLENSGARIDHCVISENLSENSGGGISCSGSSFLVEHCTISGNTAPVDGGGINLKSGSSMTMNDCILSGNIAEEGYGGGLNIVMSTAYISGSRITGNRTAESGGGIFNGVNSEITLETTLVSGNHSDGMAGGIYAGSGMDISGCTISLNHAPLYGSGIEIVSGPSTPIENSIIAFNTGSEGLYTIIGDADISCSNLFGNTAGDYGGGGSDLTGINGNISLDPQFCDTLGGDWRVSTGSPCLPAGNSCQALMGALGAGCGELPELEIRSVNFEPEQPRAKEGCNAIITVRNSGNAGADTVVVNLWPDARSIPPAGSPTVLNSAFLQAGDSVVLEAEVSREEPGLSRVYLVLDPQDLVSESNEQNNSFGPVELEWSGEQQDLPSYTALKNIYPNPSRGSVNMEYDLSSGAIPEISIFDTTGRVVRLWRGSFQEPGSYIMIWDGRNERGWKVASGVYIVRFKADGVNQSRKTVILR